MVRAAIAVIGIALQGGEVYFHKATLKGVESNLKEWVKVGSIN